MRSQRLETSDDALSGQNAHDMLRARCDKLERQFLDVYQENLGLAAAAQDAQEHDGSDSQPFVEMRARLKRESMQRSLAEKRLFDLEAELSDARLRLHCVDGDEHDAPLFASRENEMLHAENARLLGRVKTLDQDLDEHRSLLRFALLDVDATLKESEDGRLTDEVKLITEQLRAVLDDPDRTDDMALRLAERIEQSRLQTIASDAQLAQEREDHRASRADFDTRLKRADEIAAKGTKVRFPFQLAECSSHC